MKQLIKFVVFIIIMLLLLGIGLQHYISQPMELEKIKCHKGRLLTQVEGEGAVYTRVKGFTCDFEKGMLIIEEQS